MKITLIGAAGVRTPLIVKAMAERQDRLGLEELALMDIDGQRLETIHNLALTISGAAPAAGFRLTATTDAAEALAGADFVITTFRVGGAAGRVIDERVPLAQNVLGQETTGPGGFAMGLRSIPVLLDYLKLMEKHCPHAWLINFANPAGLLAQAAVHAGGWQRSVGICDAPAGMQRLAAAVLGAPVEQVHLDYFGLNHLGWVHGVHWQGNDYLPDLIAMLRGFGGLPFLPFNAEFIAGLGMIPNEYLYYYYYPQQAVQHILQSGQTRGEQILALNEALFADLSHPSLPATNVYQTYMHKRSSTYMAHESGREPHLGDLAKQVPAEMPGNLSAALEAAVAGEGYAGVALDLIEALSGGRERRMILNIPNRGTLPGLQASDVIETPAYVGRDLIQPLAAALPQTPQISHCLGLVQQVKAYERLTIEAAVEHSYPKAWLALSLHPLVPDSTCARLILDNYLSQHEISGSPLPRLE